MEHLVIRAGTTANLLAQADRQPPREAGKSDAGKKGDAAPEIRIDFSLANSLRDLAAEVEQLHDAMAQAVVLIRKTAQAVDSLAAALEGMRGIVDEAEGARATPAREALAQRFDQLYAHLNGVADGAGHAGVNLIGNSGNDPQQASASDLSVALDAQGTVGYVLRGRFLGSRYLLREAPGAPPVRPSADGSELLGDGLAVATAAVKVQPANYEGGVFGVTFAGAAVRFRTYCTERQGLGLYHSWLYDRFASRAGIAAARADLSGALAQVTEYAARIGESSMAVAVAREPLRIGAPDDPAPAGLDAESIDLLMLRARRQLGSTPHTLASHPSQAVIRILD